MGWSQYSLWQFRVNSNTYQFAPTELVGFGAGWEESTNQVVQEAESGRIKVLQLDENVRRNYTFRIEKMPWDDRTLGTFTIRGLSSLLTMIRTDAEYRANTIEFWDRTRAKTSSATADVRFWSASFGIEEVLRTGVSTIGDPGPTLYGSGRDSVTFRLEIT